MAIYDGVVYRGGFQGYVHYAQQTGDVVGIADTTDPSPVSDVVTPVGLVPYPGLSVTENRMPVTAAGSARELYSALGRREYTLSMRAQLADATFLTNAIRNHAAPDTEGTRKGLPLLTVEYGIDDAYGAEAYAQQAVDALINTWSFEAQEGQILQANFELWFTALLDTEPQTRVEAANNVLIWSNLTITHGGTDYHSVLSSVRISGSNNLERIGCRHQMGYGASELAISRTPYSIQPRLEQIQIAYTLHDSCPPSLYNTADWSTVTLRAEHPTGAPNRRYVQIVIDHQYINRYQRGMVDANQIIRYTLDQAAYGITITAGTLS